MITHHLAKNGVLRPHLTSDQLQAYEAITEKIANGTYTWETPQCPTCQRQDFQPLTKADRYGLPYAAVTCAHCGLFQVAPRLTEDALVDFYTHHYRQLYGGVMDVSRARSLAAKERGRIALQHVSEEVVLLPGTRVVEIGCAAGAQLQAFRTAKCNVTGYDYDEIALKLGEQEFGLDLRRGGLDTLAEDVAAGAPRPDVVLYIHVFEHLSDPRRELAKLAEVLEPRGCVYLEVPGLSSCLRNLEVAFDQYFEFAHTYHFDKATLTDLVEACGWSVVWSDHYVRMVLTPKPDETPPATRALAVIAASEEARVIEEERWDTGDPMAFLSTLLRGGAGQAQAYFRTGEILFNRNDARATEYLKIAHELEPTRGKYAFLLARAMIANAQTTSEALLPVLEASVRYLPNAPYPLFHLANTLYSLGRSQEAIGHYATAIRLRPDVALFHYRLGLAYQSIAHWTGAINCFQTTISYDPTITYAYFHAGMAYEKLGNFELAVEAYKQAHARKTDPMFQQAIERCQTLAHEDGERHMPKTDL